MLTLLALNPSRITAEALAYGDRGNPVTARAEIHRLRARPAGCARRPPSTEVRCVLPPSDPRRAAMAARAAHLA